MTIFYTASFFGKDRYQKEYDLVLATLGEFGVKLIGTEVGNYKETLSDKTRERFKDQPKLLHYEAISRGIHLAEAVVIECSHEDFQLGHEASLAILEKKPVLCLSIHEDLSKRIFHPFFFGAHYSEKNIKSVIQDFLARVREMSLTKRFNMFLYPHQVEYLETVSKRSGVNMSEYVRKLINADKQIKKE